MVRCVSLRFYVDVLKGANVHHVSEAVFKAFEICCRRDFEAESFSSIKRILLVVWG
ncbi:MAG: hypothetical protein ACKESB_02080 [Candidatus Hodgkinia cicadicola]